MNSGAESKMCLVCESVFYKTRSHTNKRWDEAKYCSARCNGARSRTRPLNKQQFARFAPHEEEVWVVINECPDFEVSNLGSVRRCASGWATRVGRRLKPVWDGHEGFKYPAVRLRKNGKQWSRRVHVLVAEAFLGPRPDGFHAAHLDGDRANCRLSNIVWATPKENCHHKFVHGTMACGERQGSAKLNTAQVLYIKNTPLEHGSGARLARELGVSKSLISAVRNGLWWKHIEDRTS